MQKHIILNKTLFFHKSLPRVYMYQECIPNCIQECIQLYTKLNSKNYWVPVLKLDKTNFSQKTDFISMLVTKVSMERTEAN